jgi:hypothetical protein
MPAAYVQRLHDRVISCSVPGSSVRLRGSTSTTSSSTGVPNVRAAAIPDFRFHSPAITRFPGSDRANSLMAASTWNRSRPAG